MTPEALECAMKDVLFTFKIGEAVHRGIEIARCSVRQAALSTHGRARVSGMETERVATGAAYH